MMKPKEAVYRCPRCGNVSPKEEAVILRWNSEHSSIHIYCPKCGKIIARFVK